MKAAIRWGKVARACWGSVALFLAFAGMPVLADGMKAGLWEVTSRVAGVAETDRLNAQIRQQLATLPPAQREEFEKRLLTPAPGVPATAEGGDKTRFCVTPETARQKSLPLPQRPTCTNSAIELTERTAKGKTVCTEPPMSMEAEFTLVDDSAYTLKMTMTAIVNGAAQDLAINMTGKWLGDDCGNVQPRKISSTK